ncbi:MAG: ComEC/Rec2 family competence protein [Methanoregula sp.]|jgi:beta-lactamase superfamily II metal-dependent hydrolase
MQKAGSYFSILVLLTIFSGCTQAGYFSAISAQQTTSPHFFPAGTASPGNLSVSFIDVGQGDSILIRSPGGKTMLIDAGPTVSSSCLLGYLEKGNISSLDIALATHSHEDHIGGMPAVLNTFPVGRFIYNGFPGTTTYYDRLVKTIAKKKIPLSPVTAGDTIDLDPALSISVLNPQKTFFDDPNNNSIVLRLVYRNVSFLFTGDASKDAERAILAGGENISVTVLKVGHHGDSRSTSTAFLDAVRPEIAVIDAGYENDHHNPSNKTLARLMAANVTVYRTDLDGTIMIETDGTDHWVSPVPASPVHCLPSSVPA